MNATDAETRSTSFWKVESISVWRAPHPPVCINATVTSPIEEWFALSSHVFMAVPVLSCAFNKSPFNWNSISGSDALPFRTGFPYHAAHFRSPPTPLPPGVYLDSRFSSLVCSTRCVSLQLHFLWAQSILYALQGVRVKVFLHLRIGLVYFEVIQGHKIRRLGPHPSCRSTQVFIATSTYSLDYSRWNFIISGLKLY